MPQIASTVVLVLLALAATTTAQGPLQSDLRAQLERRLQDIADGVDGVVGYVVEDLTAGARVAARHEREPFPTASAIKVPVMYELIRQADEGRLRLDVAAPLDRAQVVGGSGVLQHLTTPALSLRDHAALMMIVSDNTSTNIIIDTVGMGNVTARMRTLGMGDVLLRRKMMDAEAVRRGDENVASPASLLRSTVMLWRGEGLSESGRDVARGILRLVPGAIRGAVPARVVVYSKTGSLDAVRAETAVVDLPGAPFGLAVMTTYLKDDAAGTRAIGEIAAAAFAYFERLASGGRYGRRQ